VGEVSSLEAAIMALSLDEIRRTADRVAASHGLDIVEIEYLGGPKQRVLRVFIEKNRQERARLAEQACVVAATVESSSVREPDEEQRPEKRRAGQRAGKVTAEDGDQIAIAPLRHDLDQLAGVTHEDCERFSHDFGTVLDVEELVPGTEYTLEVSSPGLDRRLTGRADYQRFEGSLIKVQTRNPIAGNRHWQGRLTQVTAEGVVLDLTATKQRSKKKGIAAETIEIGIANIEKANLIPEI
jgi:ribosome maturation factor RimP